MILRVIWQLKYILTFWLFALKISLANLGYIPAGNYMPQQPSVNYSPRGQSLIADMFDNKEPVTTDTRIKTLVYNENEVYKLKFHYGYQSHIEFREGEEIELLSIGESFSWNLTPVGRRLFIRPLDISSHTNMTIITNMASYEIDLRSSEYDGSADEELVYKIRFYHPPLKPEPKFPVGIAAKKPARPVVNLPKTLKYEKTPPAQINLDLHEKISGKKKGEKLNFNYSMSGESPAIKPLRVYDNGKETFFKFKKNNLIVPRIKIVDNFGNEISTRQKERNGYIVVPEIAKQFTLRMNNELICVFKSASQGFIKKLNKKRVGPAANRVF